MGAGGGNPRRYGSAAAASPATRPRRRIHGARSRAQPVAEWCRKVMRHAARRPRPVRRARWHGDGHGAALRHLRPAADLRAAGLHRPSRRDLPRPGLHGLRRGDRGGAGHPADGPPFAGVSVRTATGGWRSAACNDRSALRGYRSAQVPRRYTSRLDNLVHESPARRRPRVRSRVGRHRQHRIPRRRGRHRREAGRHVLLVTADRRQLQRLERRPPAPVRLGVLRLRLVHRLLLDQPGPAARLRLPAVVPPARLRLPQLQGGRAVPGQQVPHRRRVLPRPEGQVRHVQRLRQAGLHQPCLDVLPGRGARSGTWSSATPTCNAPPTSRNAASSPPPSPGHEKGGAAGAPFFRERVSARRRDGCRCSTRTSARRSRR